MSSNKKPPRPLPPSGAFINGRELRLVPDARCPYPGCEKELKPFHAKEIDGGGFWLGCPDGHDFLNWG